MANILFRGTIAPSPPALVAGGSAAKGTPLTNDEGDWNYKALNDDIQTRAPIANPSFTGITSFEYNLRSVLAKYNKYVAGIAGSIASCKIGEYMPSGNSINASLIVEVIGRTTGHLAYAKAKILYRSETLPATVVTITNEKYRNNTTDLTIEAYVDNSSGRLVLFANVAGTLTNISFNVDVYERNADNLFSLQTTYVAKNTTGLTQITETIGTSTFGGTINASLNGNASTATILQNSRTINGIPFDGSANIVIDAETPNVITFASSGGDAPGTTFDGSFARTISYATVGAPSVSGTGATGTWAISISGNSATSTSAVNATTSARLGTLMSDVSTSQAVVAGSHYNVITTAVTLTLPASPAEGDTIFFTATATNWSINRNGKYIMGLAENMLVDVSQKITFGLKFVRNNASNGWMLI